MHVIDGGRRGRCGRTRAARGDDGAAALADRRDEFFADPLVGDEVVGRFALNGRVPNVGRH